ncbi:MAG: CHAP domain-containing protein [Rhodopila sp.]
MGSALLIGSPLFAVNAQAAPHDRTDNPTIKQSTSFHLHPISHRLTITSGGRISPSSVTLWTGARPPARSFGISCVPYARKISGIMVVGNAWQWWDRAEGVYARGDQPEVGSVLNFRANHRMHLGHVAVVTRVVNPREIIVDHANWPHGVVMHNVSVVDVSEANNWSAVRVELGRGDEFGSVYPTYGFIYNRPDTGFVGESVARPAPQPVLNEVPSDLRPSAERSWHTVEEVAEAPPAPRHQIDLKISGAAITDGQ